MSHAARTAPERCFGPLQCQRVVGIVMREQIPESVSSHSHPGPPNDMAVLQDQSHPASDVSWKRTIGLFG